MSEWTPASIILTVLAVVIALTHVIIPGVRLWLTPEPEPPRCRNCDELVDDPAAPFGKRCGLDATYRWRDPGPLDLTSCDQHTPK